MSATAATQTSDDEWSLAPTSAEAALAIPAASAYRRDAGLQACHAALLRSLRAAGVQFLRFATVDAFNTPRCKAVPIDRLLAQPPDRTQPRTSNAASPLDNPVSIAEICFAGLPSHADAPVEGTGLTAKNVLALHPDFASLRVLPYAPRTAVVMCTAHDQRTKELSPLCTRGLLERVLQEAREGMQIEFCVGAELEFQLYRSETRDGAPQPVDGSTFANSVTLDEQEEFISDLYDQLGAQDIPTELIHAESAPGQLEVVLSYTNNVVQLGDDITLARATISACAKKHGMKALFLPKTSMLTAGNGLHLHFSFRDVGSSNNAFKDETQVTGISQRGGAFVEGILGHLPSLLSFTLPTANSFRRVGPGCWTGSKVGWSTEDKDVPVRVCMDLNTGNATNVELKLSDATANIYLSLATVLAAGMDGIKRERTLRPAMDDVTASEPLPGTLQESLDLLKKNELLLHVLGSELNTAYIAVRESEAQIEKTLEEEVVDAFNKA
ncbi:hypothetical protein ACHAXT_006325 [Thalassiosira profunda]